MNIIRRIKKRFWSNNYLYDGSPVKKNQVNLEFWNVRVNVGDQLSMPIVKWMLAKKDVVIDKPISRTRHLLALGSIIGSGRFDATVWGSGVNTAQAIYNTGKFKKNATLIIKAVRGPITKEILSGFGYDCKGCVFGDPGILMPLIFKPEPSEKIYDVSIIGHFKMAQYINSKYPQYHYINVETSDYKTFIQEICASKKIISSSLHGIILAESYGIPAVFYNENGMMDREIIKYYDWYYLTNRRSVVCASTIEEALHLTPMELPKLDSMREQLMHMFPYELWEIT